MKARTSRRRRRTSSRSRCSNGSITERALLQYAKETGIRVDDTQVERAILRIAAGQQAVRRRIPQGASSARASRTRNTARTSATRSRSSALREREVDSTRQRAATPRSTICLATSEAQAGGEVEYRLAHILVLVPEQASPDQIDARQRRAETALHAGALRHRFRAGRRGLLGRAGRAAGRRPRLAHAGAAADRCSPIRSRSMKPGDVVGRAALGERLSHRQAARDAQPQLADGRRADARAAHPGQGQRNHVERRGEGSRSTASASGSSRARSSRTRRRPTRRTRAPPKGGDLGWVSPGDTVPDFEQAMNRAQARRALGAGAHAVRLAHHPGAGAAHAGRHQGAAARAGAAGAAPAQVRRGVPGMGPPARATGRTSRYASTSARRCAGAVSSARQSARDAVRVRARRLTRNT